MASNGGLTSHLACLVYVPYLGKLYDPENHKFSFKEHLLGINNANYIL